MLELAHLRFQVANPGSFRTDVKVAKQLQSVAFEALVTTVIYGRKVDLGY
jgi:hypothetical protein